MTKTKSPYFIKRFPKMPSLKEINQSKDKRLCCSDCLAFWDRVESLTPYFEHQAEQKLQEEEEFNKLQKKLYEEHKNDPLDIRKNNIPIRTWTNDIDIYFKQDSVNIRIYDGKYYVDVGTFRVSGNYINARIFGKELTNNSQAWSVFNWPWLKQKQEFTLVGLKLHQANIVYANRKL